MTKEKKTKKDKKGCCTSFTDNLKWKVIKEAMKKHIPVYLLSMSSAFFNVGTIILAIVILEYYAIIYFTIVFIVNFVVQYYVGTLWLSKVENRIKLEFKHKEGKKRFSGCSNLTKFTNKAYLFVQSDC